MSRVYQTMSLPVLAHAAQRSGGWDRVLARGAQFGSAHGEAQLELELPAVGGRVEGLRELAVRVNGQALDLGSLAVGAGALGGTRGA